MMATVEEALADPAIRAYLLRIIGEEGMGLITKFPKEGEHSDEELASMTQINLNSVRHTLYTLYEKRLAFYRRLKNNETGWLTYLWQLRLDSITDAIIEDLTRIIEKLEARRKYEEENDFYKCSECGYFITFNRAFDLDFTCPGCKNSYQHFDNEILVSSLKKRIELIRESLGEEGAKVGT